MLKIKKNKEGVAINRSMLERWQDDHYLSKIKEQYEQSSPEESEVCNLLRFLLIFSMGCRGMGLDDIADRFNNRANLFSLGITQLGFNSRRIVASISNQIKRWV